MRNGFEILLRGSDGSYSVIAIAPAHADEGPTSLPLTSLIPGTEYSYRVRAFTGPASSKTQTSLESDPVEFATPLYGNNIYHEDFNGLVGSEWSSSTTDVTPVGDRQFLGQFDGMGGASLSLNNLPSHEMLTISFDLFAIRSWDGNDVYPWGQDGWSLSVQNGPTLIDTTFSNLDYMDQAYSPTNFEGTFPYHTGAAEAESLGYQWNGQPMDSVYRLVFTFAHQDASIVFDFASTLTEYIDNESWGIDNVFISIPQEIEAPTGAIDLDFGIRPVYPDASPSDPLPDISTSRVVPLNWDYDEQSHVVNPTEGGYPWAKDNEQTSDTNINNLHRIDPNDSDLRDASVKIHLPGTSPDTPVQWGLFLTETVKFWHYWPTGTRNRPYEHWGVVTDGFGRPDSQNKEVNFKVEGVSGGLALVRLRVMAADQPGLIQYGDFQFVDVYGADLDIDSDNNDGVSLPQRSDHEEYQEDVPYGQTQQGNYGKQLTVGQFVPMVLELPFGAPSLADLRLDFLDQAAGGVLKVWRKDKDDPTRTAADEIAANTAISGESLGLNNTDRTVTLWVEALNYTSGGAEQFITLYVARSGASAWMEPYDRVSVSSLDPNADDDDDGLTNSEEGLLGTNPFYFDTDDDLLPDGWENTYNPPFDPLVPNDAQGDADGDGVVNLDEGIFGTDPTSGDSDGDGVGDDEEINSGADPTDPTDDGIPPADDMKGKFKLTVGDWSGSHSKRWQLNVGGIRHVAPTYGEVGDKDFFFRAGTSHPIQLKHLGTKPEFLQQYGAPDYDWVAQIEPVGLPSLPHFFIDDDPKILGDHGPSTTNPVNGKSSWFHLPMLDADVDSDNSGTIDYSDHEDRLEQTATGAKTIFAGATQFTPFDLYLSPNLSEAQLSGDIQLTFSGFDSSILRLWKPGFSVPDSGTPGVDDIAPGSTIAASALALSPGGRVTLYLEALKGAAAATAIDVVAQVNGQRFTGQLTDKAHVRVGAIDLDVNGDKSLEDDFDGAENYLPGYGPADAINTALVPKLVVDGQEQRFSDPQYAAQKMKLVVEGQGLQNIQFTITDDVTKKPGFAENASDPKVEGATKDHDYSFKELENDREEAGVIEGNKAWVDFWAKDYGGRATIRAIGMVNGQQQVIGELTIPLDRDGDGIADRYERQELARWNAQYGKTENPDAAIAFFIPEDDKEPRDPDDGANADGGADLPMHKGYVVGEPGAANERTDSGTQAGRAARAAT